MTESKRIFWNVVATYGRSLYGLILGLLCGRWALMALGEVDYGLNGLVGGLTAFISFFNGVLAGANSRFYAFAVGAAKVAKDQTNALEECRHWFNTALSVHLVVPLVLIAIGYPIGVYAIEQWLTIPASRICACIWVFRFVCISCFVGMVNVPFTAMYGAKQYIAELTIYSFITSTLNVMMLYYMISHPRVWLARFALWACILSVVPQIIICVRACLIFPECKFRISYMWDRNRLRKLGAFAGWQMCGVLCAMLRTNGMSIVINKFFGASMNAAQALGNTVQGQCNMLAAAMQGAFTPVLVQACGAGDYVKMNKFALRTCKFNVLLSLLFMLPLALELPYVMRLWLKTPPACAIGLCYCAMLLHLAGCCTAGHMIVVNAVGKVALYHVVLGSISIFTVPFAVIIGVHWRNVYAVVSVVVLMEVVNSVGRIAFAKVLAGTSVMAWIRTVLLPSLIVILIGGAVGRSSSFIMGESFARLCVTVAMTVMVYLLLTWTMFLSREEKDFIAEKFLARIAAILKFRR